MENSMNPPDDLYNEFEELRKQLVNEALKHGLTDPFVICLSQQLDKVHNQIMKS